MPTQNMEATGEEARCFLFRDAHSWPQTPEIGCPKNFRHCSKSPTTEGLTFLRLFLKGVLIQTTTLKYSLNEIDFAHEPILNVHVALSSGKLLHLILANIQQDEFESRWR